MNFLYFANADAARQEGRNQSAHLKVKNLVEAPLPTAFTVL